jgi:hypothetical protein
LCFACPGGYNTFQCAGIGDSPAGVRVMRQVINVNPTSEHALYLRLFVTNAGGW